MKELIIFFAEVVWDQLEAASVLGGAPLTVSRYLQAAGCLGAGEEVCNK